MVTKHADLRAFAKKIGVSFFKKLSQAERGVWLEPSGPTLLPNRTNFDSIIELRNGSPQETPNFKVGPKFRYFIIAAMTVVFMIVLLILLPSATMIIYPESQRQELQLEVHAATKITQTSLTGMIPAQKVQITLSGEKSAVSSGSVHVGQTKAIGEVVVTNLTNQDIFLSEGTVFSTAFPDPIRFISLEEVLIQRNSPPVVVHIEALNAGEEGNVGEGEIVTLEGVADSSLVVTNEIATTDGTSISLPAPSENDYALLTTKLLEELRNQAIEQSLLTSGESRKPIPESLELEEMTSIDQANPVGEVSDSLTVRITAQFGILYYNPAELTKLLNDVIDLTKPEGYQYAESRLSVEMIGKPINVGKGEITWLVRAERPVYKSLTQQDLRKLINGRSIKHAIELTNASIPHYQSSEVKSFIGWWPYIPVLLNKIQFEEEFQDGR